LLLFKKEGETGDRSSGGEGSREDPTFYERIQMKFFLGSSCFQRQDFQEHIVVGLVEMLIEHRHQVNPPFEVDSTLEVLLVLFSITTTRNCSSHIHLSKNTSYP
jgi:hypothetical protein